MKSIARFSSVSRDWRWIISSKPFIISRQEESIPSPHISIQRDGDICSEDLFSYGGGRIFSPTIRMYRYDEARTPYAATVCFQEDQQQITQRLHLRPIHSDGLLLFSVSPSRTYLCNPTTGKLMALPTGGLCCDPPAVEYNLGLGLDPRTSQHKAVRYFCPSDNRMGCHVQHGGPLQCLLVTPSQQIPRHRAQNSLLQLHR